MHPRRMQGVLVGHRVFERYRWYLLSSSDIDRLSVWVTNGNACYTPGDGRLNTSLTLLTAEILPWVLCVARTVHTTPIA